MNKQQISEKNASKRQMSIKEGFKRQKLEPKKDTDARTAKDAGSSYSGVGLGPAFGLLDDDALRCVLIRANAEDHAALHGTCKKFNESMKTPRFRRERALLENNRVDVRVELVDAFEQYKKLHNLSAKKSKPSRKDERFVTNFDEFGFIGEMNTRELKFKVYIDHKERDDVYLRVYLLPRPQTRHGCFHETCDALEGPLSELAQNCFNNNGKPKVKSLKQALRNDDKPMLYITSFSVPQEYRDDDFKCTIGPMILSKMLTEIKTLKHKWSIVMYIPSYHSQLTASQSSERHEHNRTFPREGDRKPTDEELRREKELADQNDRLTRYDMRMFFRAGFRQVNDKSVVNSVDGFYVYAVPTDLLQTAGGCQPWPLRTEASVRAMKIVAKPPPALKKTELEKRFFGFFRRTAQQREALSPETLALCETRFGKSVDLLLETTREELGITATSSGETASGLNEMDKLIINSCAIHACCFHGSKHFVELLLGLLSDNDHARSKALSSLDEDGWTPLMVAARNIGDVTGSPVGTADTRAKELEKLRKRRAFCEYLLGLDGVDPDETNPEGLTAYGILQKKAREQRRFDRDLGIKTPSASGQNPTAREFKRLLECCKPTR
eukprot:jgi/Psemu1/327102/estExt_fgenesh1_pg.C_5480004